MLLRQHDYRDPAKVAEERERHEQYRREQVPTCYGCKHRVVLWGLALCAIGNAAAGDLNMKRCAEYENGKKGNL